MKDQSTSTKKSPGVPLVPTGFTAEEMSAVLSGKDRDSFERQIVNLQTKAAAGSDAVWRRLTGVLMALASKLVKINGLQSVLFYIPDGRHRKQVYALHVNDTAQINVIIPNVIDAAIAAKLITPVKTAEPGQYKIGAGADQIFIQPLSGDTLNPLPHFKEMTGWNRKAMAVVLPAEPSEAHIHLAEQLAAIASAAWPAATTVTP